jgi:hypothetical protein
MAIAKLNGWEIQKVQNRKCICVFGFGPLMAEQRIRLDWRGGGYRVIIVRCINGIVDRLTHYVISSGSRALDNFSTRGACDFQCARARCI